MDAAGAGKVTTSARASHGEVPRWTPVRPRPRPLRVAIAWLASTVALSVAAWLVPGASVAGFVGAFGSVAAIAVMNAIVPPIIAALRLPLTAVLGFLIVLCIDAAMLLAVDALTDDLAVSSFWSALGVGLVASAVGVVLDVALGTNDDDVYAYRVVQRIARRSGGRVVTDTPG